MEKRLINFMLVSLLVMMTYLYVQRLFVGPPGPQRPVANGQVDPNDGQEPGADEDGGQAGANQDGEPSADADPADPQTAQQAGVQPDADAAADQVPSTPADLPEQWVTLGSVDANSPYRMLVTVTNRGAAIERIELSHHRYQDLEDFTAYIGHLALRPHEQGGLRVNVVGSGTPAHRAMVRGSERVVGLQKGDIITHLGGATVDTVAEYEEALAKFKPGDLIPLTIERAADEQAERQTMHLQVRAVRRPLQVIRPEPEDDPLSYLLRLDTVGDRTTELGQQELPTESLASVHWEVHPVQDERGEAVEFRYRLGTRTLRALGVTGAWEIVKRYRLEPVPAEQQEDLSYPGYDLALEIEVINRGDEPQAFAYRIDGPTGLPLEGWWYAYKTHPTQWGGAGVRDVVFRTAGGRHQMFSNPDILEHTEKNAIYSMVEPGSQAQLRYAGVDAQYFVSALLADPVDDPDDPYDNAENYVFREAIARAIEPPDALKKSRTAVSFQLVTRKHVIAPGEENALKQRFQIFAGPKRPDLLAHYDLGNCIVYGWFGFVARPMTSLLHLFYAVVRNYGIAIILLTVVVRGLMFPLGRRQAQTAAKMQELAPEMKRIAETYKNDMEKRAAAQRELFRKHNYNPLSGCGLMFLQLPIFIGLYRALSVDIELRQASLIPGLRWCSNLAGPDQLIYWGDWALMPDFLVRPTGWLGPYLNLLPMISIALFLVQQKLFTPPPTDEQQEIQQKVMKFMTVFIGVLFFKVPAGLCLYFIASGLWSIGERKLLPRPTASGGSAGSSPASPAKTKSSVADKVTEMLGIKPNSTTNGSLAKQRADRRKQARKRK